MLIVGLGSQFQLFKSMYHFVKMFIPTYLTNAGQKFMNKVFGSLALMNGASS